MMISELQNRSMAIRNVIRENELAHGGLTIKPYMDCQVLQGNRLFTEWPRLERDLIELKMSLSPW